MIECDRRRDTSCAGHKCEVIYGKYCCSLCWRVKVCYLEGKLCSLLKKQIDKEERREVGSSGTF
jgi:hypothetical protein